MKNKKVISIFLFISIVGLFLPWFFFDKDVDYTNGLYWLSYTPLLLISLFTSIIILLINKVSKTINVIFFLSSLLVSVSCIYLFFTWHILNITGQIDVMVSLKNTHYGFYITFISVIIVNILSGLNLVKEKI